MTASSLFLTCFVACLFALGIVVIAAWQIGTHLIRKNLAKSLPDAVAKALHGKDAESAHMRATVGLEDAEGAAAANMLQHTPLPIDVNGVGIMKCVCGHAQPIPFNKPLLESLAAAGWRFSGTWLCPTCVSGVKAPQAGAA